MTEGELILYTTEDGRTTIQLRVREGTVWLTQTEMAQLFQSSKQNISLHIKNIFADKELSAAAVVKEYLTTAADGKNYRTLYYNLDLILAVGYRVRTLRGAQFRQWATNVLREYLVKGFALDDQRLKQAGEWDYFDELLARIRDIRASEKRFYQKIRDIYATSVDYRSDSGEAMQFFKKVQNKMLWAVARQTAAEIIISRSNPALPNMGLTAWQGGCVRKQDVAVAKNYLKPEEIEGLNRIVAMYLDYAEDQANRRKTITMREWEEKLDAFLSFNEREILKHAGKVSAAVAEALALERYEQFDEQRRKTELIEAGNEDLSALAQLEKHARKKRIK